MKCNLGQVEKSVRALVGFPLAVAGFYLKNLLGIWGQVSLWLGLWLLVTAAFSWCPATWVRDTVSGKTSS